MIKRREEAKITYKDCTEEFLMGKEALGRSPKTLESYSSSLEQFAVANSLEDSTPISDLNKNTVIKFIQYLRSKDISTNSINHYLREIRTFLYFCMGQEYITPFKVELVKGQEEPPKFFTQEEVKKLIKKPTDKAKFVEWRSYMICMFVYATGARANTIVNMKVSDLDFKNRTITYAATKSKKSQTVPMSNKLNVALKEYLKLWQLGKWLFPNRDGSQLTVNALKHSIARHCEYRKVDKTSIHGLRHSFAREWVKNGGDVFKLQQILGHSTLEMTRRYVRLFAEDLQDGFSQFNPLDSMDNKRKKE